MINFGQSYCPMFQKLKGVGLDERVKYNVIRTYLHYKIQIPANGRHQVYIRSNKD